jgi:hypothetical protein
MKKNSRNNEVKDEFEFLDDKPDIFGGIILPILTIAIFLPSFFIFGFFPTLLITAGLMLIIYLVSLFFKK